MSQIVQNPVAFRPCDPEETDFNVFFDVFPSIYIFSFSPLEKVSYFLDQNSHE